MAEGRDGVRIIFWVAPGFIHCPRALGSLGNWGNGLIPTVLDPGQLSPPG